MLVRFHFERRIFHQERPHVIAQSIGVKVALVALWEAEQRKVQSDLPLESSLS